MSNTVREQRINDNISLITTESQGIINKSIIENVDQNIKTTSKDNLGDIITTHTKKTKSAELLETHDDNKKRSSNQIGKPTSKHELNKNPSLTDKSGINDDKNKDKKNDSYLKSHQSSNNNSSRSNSKRLIKSSKIDAKTILVIEGCRNHLSEINQLNDIKMKLETVVRSFDEPRETLKYPCYIQNAYEQIESFQKLIDRLQYTGRNIRDLIDIYKREKEMYDYSNTTIDLKAESLFISSPEYSKFLNRRTVSISSIITQSFKQFTFNLI